MIKLTIYDDDGPEGYYEVLEFERSYQAVQFLIDHWADQDFFKDYNYTIENKY